jgi:DNA-binding response OmpR family regulator
MEPLQVLLVEDNLGDVLLIRQALASEPYAIDVRVARDGEQGLEVLSDLQYKPDLVILDLNLPKLSGHALLERSHIAAPVIIFSSSSNPDDLLRAFELGAREYVQKPTDLAEFARQVSQIVRTWGRPEPIAAVAEA